MKIVAFATALFLGTAQATTKPAATNVEPVDYTDTYDGDFALQGFVSIPGTTPAPAVVIIVSGTCGLPLFIGKFQVKFSHFLCFVMHILFLLHIF